MATYYIDYVNGDDTNNGTSTSTPWQHFPTDARATGNAKGHALTQDDTYVFKRGVVYDVVAADLELVNAPSGITVTSIVGWGAGDRAILDGGQRTMTRLFRVSGTTNNTVISNLEGRNVEGHCFDAYNTTKLTFSNLVAHSASVTATEAYGIYVHGTMYDKNYINDCEVYSCRHYGFVTANNDSSTTNTIELNRCVSHDNGSADGFRSDNNCGNITWNDCISYSNVQDGFDLYNTRNKILNRCTAYDNGSAGFKMGPLNVAAGNGNKVQYCVAYGNDDAGIRSNEGDYILAYNNTTYNNAIGFEFYYSENNVIKNNIGYNNTINLQQNTLSNVDENNIWYHSSPTGVNAKLKEVEYHNNDLAAYKAASGKVGDGTKFTDPLLADPAKNNFNLKSSSPAINAGVDLGFTVDHVKNEIKGLPDIGAYEYVKKNIRRVSFYRPFAR